MRPGLLEAALGAVRAFRNPRFHGWNLSLRDWLVASCGLSVPGEVERETGLGGVADSYDYGMRFRRGVVELKILALLERNAIHNPTRDDNGAPGLHSSDRNRRGIDLAQNAINIVVAGGDAKISD